MGSELIILKGHKYGWARHLRLVLSVNQKSVDLHRVSFLFEPPGVKMFQPPESSSLRMFEGDFNPSNSELHCTKKRPSRTGENGGGGQFDKN